MIRTYKKKRIVVDAIEYDGTPESAKEIVEWTRNSDTPAHLDIYPILGGRLSVVTLEGAMWVSKGDYVVRGILGEHYPIKPDIFKMTYVLDL